jgi:tetratricopeptide (TPR) repeat protein
MRAFLLFLLVGIITSGSGQTKLTDSLRREVKRLGSTGETRDSLYINVLTEFAYSIQYSNPDSSLFYAEQAKRLSRVAGFDKGYAEAVRNMGIVHYLRGDYLKALEFFYDGLRVADEIKNSKCIGRLHNNIGLVYYAQGKYNEALASQLKALAIREKIGDKSGIATSLNNIANIYKNLNNYDESLHYHEKSLAVKRGLRDIRGIAASLNNIGWLFIKQNKFENAQEYLEEAKPLLPKAKDKILSSDVLQGLAECYLMTGKHEPALELAKEALAIGQSINLRDQLRDCNETLSKIYKAKGDFKLALSHHETFKLYADSLNNAEIEKKTSALAAEYEFEKKETTLKAEHEKQSLQQWWMVATALVSLLFVSVVTFFIFRSRRKLEHAFHKLEIANLEIQNKSSELWNINQTLEQQKEEISAQRDLVAAQNQKLNEANAIIGSHNIVLEHEVERRTRELREYARQLEEFAFITAHELRAPVATILGLANLMDTIGHDKEEREMIYCNLISTTKKLDAAVKELNQKLNNRPSGNSILVKKPVRV